jgi:L-glyceraldehyde 3-phosphate reductase
MFFSEHDAHFILVECRFLTKHSRMIAHRRCGRSGVLLPEISLGLWHNFGDVDDPSEARAMILHAFDQGITHFDLANNYGPPPGSAEKNFGTILEKDLAAHRDELFISTKAGHAMWPGPHGEWGSRKHVLASLDQSLQRMRLPYVDVFYSHRPDPHTPLEETMSALITAVQSGRALYVGLSKYPLPMLQEAVSILRASGVRPLLYQPPYSILNRWPEAEGIHEWLEHEGIGSIVFSPLAQGMLTPKYLDGIPAGSRAAREEGFLQESQVIAQQEKLRALHAVAESLGLPLHHMALRWALQQQGVTSLIVGARNVAQLDDNLAALKIPELPMEALQAIDRIAPAVRKEHAEG